MFRASGTSHAPLTAAVLCIALGACHYRAPAETPDGREDTVQAGNSTRVEEVLAGKFPGVRVLHHGNGRLTVEIRGRSSFTGGTEPLYVIDGMQVEDSDALIGINPNDIENIEVLRDINSLSFYGSRGANGVVLITMKRR